MLNKQSRREFLKNVILATTGIGLTACQQKPLIATAIFTPQKPLSITSTNTIPTQTSTPTPQPTPVSISDLKLFLATHGIREGDTSRKVVMMTYDDEGSPSEIESILIAYRQNNNTKATFFFIGESLQICAKSVEKIVTEGHLLGCHSWSHPFFPFLSDAEIQRQFEKYFAKIQEILPGYVLKYFRLPYGAGYKDPRILKIAAEWGLQHVYWTMGSNGNNPHTYRIVMNHAKNGSIVLSHMFRQYDYTDASKIVNGLISKGFSLETVDTGINPKDQRPS